MGNSEKRADIRGLAVDLTLHFVLTFSLAIFFYRQTGGWLYSVLAICGGILIDLDHFVDYFRYYGFRKGLKEFFGQTYQASGKMFVPFHSWEIVIILWVFSLTIKWFVPLAAGMTVHLLVDQFLSHKRDIFVYLLLYRIYHKFEFKKLKGKYKKTD